jgi:D-hydroxyproline dehydrogenase subunit alpha
MSSVLVVGAGPAGLAAAVAALDAGARVTLLDASDETGGQYWRHLPAVRAGRDEARLHHGWTAYQALHARVAADPACELILGAQVWSVEPDAASPCGRAFNVSIGTVDHRGATMRAFSPDAAVLATGAHDRTLPFPGWELPGVFTGGAAQALAKGERVRVGRRVIVSGAGPFLLPVAASVAETGSRVVEVVEANRVPRLLRGWSPKPWQLWGARSKAGELVEYGRSFVRHRIPYRTGAAVVAAHGTDRVEAVTVARLDADWAPVPGTERRVEVDAVCVTHDFTPRLEVAVAAGCELTDQRFIVADDTQQTTVAGIYAAGEVTGIGGVDLAMAEGAIAGAHAAGRHPSDAVIRRRSVFAGFAARIAAAHGIRPGWRKWMSDDTVVCRCEEVTYGALCSAVESAPGLRSLKLTTRASLGICQGRICGRTVEDVLGRATRSADGARVDRRPIVTPQRLGDLARLESETTGSAQ